MQARKNAAPKCTTIGLKKVRVASARFLVQEAGAERDGDKQQSDKRRRAGADEHVEVVPVLERVGEMHARQPRPTNGILFAITVMNSTLASSGRLAM